MQPLVAACPNLEALYLENSYQDYNDGAGFGLSLLDPLAKLRRLRGNLAHFPESLASRIDSRWPTWNAAVEVAKGWTPAARPSGSELHRMQPKTQNQQTYSDRQHTHAHHARVTHTLTPYTHTHTRTHTPSHTHAQHTHTHTDTQTHTIHTRTHI